MATGRVSAVYRARDVDGDGALYAIKELSPIAMFRPDERRELESRYRAHLARWREVTHPGVAAIVDAFTERGRYYVVSEFVQGWSMRRLIAEGRVRVTPRLAANWGAQLCEVLEHLHGRTPAFHTPFLAPGHVMVGADGAVKLVDLGLTCLFIPADCGPHGSVAGYAAPELSAGPPSDATDQFALGRLLYALLVGRLLERGIPRNLSLQRAVPDIPPSLVRAIARAAHRDPTQRYAAIAELRRDLWGDAAGPLEPIPGWFEGARVEEPQPRGGAPRSAGGPSMADFGFEPDPRYATAGSTPSAPQASPAPAPEPAPTDPARLTVQPGHLKVVDLRPDESRRVAVSLRNVGNVPVEGRLTSHVSWITAPGKTFRLPAAREAKAIIRVSGRDLAVGETTEPQALSVDTNAGRHWIAVTAQVPSGPLLELSPPVLDYGVIEGEGERALTLTISNPGTAPLAGAARAAVDWLRVPRPDFVCGAGAQVAVPVHLLPERLPPGPQAAERAVLVDSDAGQATVEARVWLRQPRLELGATQLALGDLLSGETARAALPVRNAGDGSLAGRARPLVPWLQVIPEEFTCGAGEMVELTVIADTAGLGEGPIALPEALRIQTNAGAHTVGVGLRVLAPRLVLGTGTLDYGELVHGDVAERTLSLRNAGSAPLHADLQVLVDWISLDRGAIDVPPGEGVSLTVRADTSRFGEGAEIAAQPVLRVAEGPRLHDVAATLTVLRAVLRVEPETLDFGYADPASPIERTLTVANDGTGRLAWHAVSDAPWLELQPGSGVCGPGEAQEIRLRAYGLALESGTESAEGTLVINSDGGRAKVPLRLAVAHPHLECDTTFLDLGESVNYEDLSGSFRVFNYGLGRLSGEIRTDQTWLVTSRSSFECETGRSVEVHVSTDMAEFPEGAMYGEGHIHLESNGGRAEVEVVISVLLEPRIEATGPVRLSARPEGSADESDERGAEGVSRQGRLTLANVGLAPAHLELIPGAEGIELSRSFCDVKPGKRVRIGVRWQGPEPTPDAEPHIEVRVHDGTQVIVPVVMSLPPAPEERAE